MVNAAASGARMPAVEMKLMGWALKRLGWVIDELQLIDDPPEQPAVCWQMQPQQGKIDQSCRW